MTASAVMFLAGMLITSQLPVLPPGWLILAGLAIGTMLLTMRRWRLAGVGLLGGGWFLLHAGFMLGDRLPVSEDRRTLSAEFVIEDFGRARGRAIVFVATAERVDLPRRLRLSWYEAEEIPRPGERWHFDVVLRTPRALANEGLFDYERWLFTQRIGATGYVRGRAEKLAEPSPTSVAFWRSALEQRLLGLLPENAAAGVMIALATGSRHRLMPDQTRTFILTGTSHLMAISGLHVGLVGGLVFLLAGRVLGVGRDGAALAALAAASAYGLLAGFGVPVRRALLMLATVTLAARWRRPLAPASGLALALLLVLLVQPLDVLTPGFALSFAAVAAILLSIGADRATSGPAPSRWQSAVRLQWRLSLLLAPLTLFLFERIAWTTMAANLVAIPVFGFVIVPATLLGGLLAGVVPAPAALLLSLTSHLLQYVLALLTWLATLPGADWQPPARDTLLLACLVGLSLTLLLPRRLPGRLIPLCLSLPLFFGRGPAMPAPGCMLADVLDVGQGLSVLIRTPGHTLLYDAGPAWASGSDAGERVVLPVLRREGIQRLDMLMISHADGDHAGGAKSIVDGVEVASIVSGEPGELDIPGTSTCRAGEVWNWDGIGFRVLWPPGFGNEGNDQSCVLEINAGRWRLLLTGDIEEASERRLVAEASLKPVDVVLVPHHGSATSSTSAFTRALEADLALVSAGYGNRWGLPREQVVKRWRDAGARVLSTGDHGALGIRLCASSTGAEITTARGARRRLWSGAPSPPLSGT